MKKYIILAMSLFTSVLFADIINLSPEFEKFLDDTSRIMSKDGRRDFNTNINYLKKEYKKAKKEQLVEECDYVVAAFDLTRRSGASNNTTGFSKIQRRGYYNIKADNENEDVFFVLSDEVLSEDGKVIRFQRGEREYVSCIYWKTEEKKKKEREERKAKKKRK